MKLALGVNSVDGVVQEWNLASDINSVDGVVGDEVTGNFSNLIPVNGATGVSITPTFSWTDSESRSWFRLEYSANSNFASSTVVDVNDTTYTVTDSLSSSTVYYWRVFGYVIDDLDPIVRAGTGLDSQTGDEAFLDALSATVTGFDSSWNTPISLDAGSSPEGITTSLIGGEYRVTEVDLRSNVNSFSALSGSIDIPEWENIKECTLINTTFNNFDTNYPTAIHSIGANLEYLYLNYSDDQIGGFEDLHPHEYYPATNNALAFEAGKQSSQFGDNTIKGDIPSFANLTGLKGYVIAFADNFGISSRSPIEVNGVSSVPSDIFGVSTMEILIIYDNWNIGGSGNTLSFPTNLNMPNLKQMTISGGSGTAWSEFDQGFMTGGYPTDLDNLPELLGWETSKHANLSGLPDLSASIKLTRYAFAETNFAGSTFPAYVVDGTLPEMDIISFKNPSGSPLTGTLPTTWGASKADLFELGYNEIEGTVPIGFWQIDMAKINLRYNNFTSIGVQDLSFLNTMTNIGYWGNDIGGEPIPYINWDTTQWNKIRFTENIYVFADMLYEAPNVSENGVDGNPVTVFEKYAQMASSITLFAYGSQKPAGESRSYSIIDLPSLTVNDFVDTYSHPDNVYKWQKSTDQGDTWSDMSNGSNIINSSQKDLQFTSLSSSDEALYRMKVTNTLFDSICSTYSLTTMTLYSQEIELINE